MILSPDTNLLVYSQDSREPDKQEAARLIVEILSREEDSIVALQVVGELFAVLTRRLKMPPALARDVATSTMTLFEAFGYDDSDVHTALTLAADGAFSYWDGLLVASAARAGCRCLISEDMQDGFRHGDLEIVSPFARGQPNPRLLALLGRQ